MRSAEPDLVFPLLYIRVPALETEAQWRKDPLLSIIGNVSKEIGRFSEKLVGTLREPWVSPEERRKQQEIDAQQRAEEQRQAEAARQAEEEKRRAKGNEQRSGTLQRGETSSRDGFVRALSSSARMEMPSVRAGAGWPSRPVFCARSRWPQERAGFTQ